MHSQVETKNHSHGQCANMLAAADKIVRVTARSLDIHMMTEQDAADGPFTDGR